MVLPKLSTYLSLKKGEPSVSYVGRREQMEVSGRAWD